MKQLFIVIVLVLVLSVPALAVDESYSVSDDTTSSSFSIVNSPPPDVAELITVDDFNAIADSGDFTFYFGQWMYAGIWYDAIFGTDGSTNLIASLRRSYDGVNGQYTIPPGGSTSLYRVSASSTQYSYNTYIPVGVVLDSLIQNDSSVMSALSSASSGGLSLADLQSWGGKSLYETLTNSNIDLSNHPYGLDWWFAGGASNSWSIHGSLSSSNTLTGNGLLPLLVGQNTFLFSSLGYISSLLASDFDSLFGYLSVPSGSVLLPDGSVGTSSSALSFSAAFNRSSLGLASILRGSSGSSVTIGIQSSNNILSALDSLGSTIVPDKWSGTIHGSSSDSIAELLVNLGSSLMSGSSVSSSTYSFDDSYNLTTSSVSSGSLASLLATTLNSIQRDTAQIRAVQASDEDIEFKKSTSDVVDSVKDDWTGSSSQSGLSASQSHELSGYQKKLGDIYSTDVSSIGDGLNLLSDGTVWSSWLTQDIADSLDTVSVVATIALDGSAFNIPEIDLASSAVHEPSGMAFDDLLGGD